MSAACDEAAKRFLAVQDRLDTLLRKALNEADTRRKVIDEIMFQCLGWCSDNVDFEEHIETGFIDYTLNHPDGRALAVIEAKRVGALYVSSASGKSANLLLKGSVLKGTLPATRQVLGYASEKSVPIACVTDGQRWLIFQTNRRDGKPVLDGKGIFFPSLAGVAADFPRFYDLLSPEGLSHRLALVQLNRAEGLVTSGEEDQVIVSPPEQAKLHERSALGQDAHLLFKQFFSSITSDSDLDMMRKCFVETQESQKADLELQKIAQKLLNGIRPIDTSESGKLQVEVRQAVEALRSENILLVGNKGSGKSTFLTRFFSDILDSATRASCVVLRVSLDKCPDAERDQLPSWSLRQLRDQAERAVAGGDTASFDELRGVFWEEYQRQRDGALRPLYDSDPVAFRVQFGQYLERLREKEPDAYVLAFLRRLVHGERKLPCIIFDNADHFPAPVQDAIFQQANALASSTPVLNIVPITDRTVWRLSKAGALQSYGSRSYYLPVPESKEILRKRIDYVKSKLNDDKDLAKSYFSAKGFRVTLANLDKFAEAVERLFVQNDFVSGMIGRLANFDIRRMLLRIFLSPEIRIDEVVRGSFGVNPGRAETLRIHRALIKGEYDRYSEEENEYVMNLFYTDPVSPSSPLLHFYLLWTLKMRNSVARVDSVDSRHWTAGELGQFLEAAGVAVEQTLVILQRLRDRVLIEALDPNVVVLRPGDRVAITEAGIAHLDLCLSSDVYLEQMSMATGLNSRRVANEIRRCRDEANSSSFEAARKYFVDYLIELDTVRTALPSVKEYEALRDARKHMRGRGSVVLPRPTPGAAPKARAVPAESVGGLFGRRGR